MHNAGVREGWNIQRWKFLYQLVNGLQRGTFTDHRSDGSPFPISRGLLIHKRRLEGRIHMKKVTFARYLNTDGMESIFITKAVNQNSAE